jgi:hypothetical protein
MLTGNTSESLRGLSGRPIEVFLKLLAMAALLTLMSAPAFSQNTYSDTWLNESGGGTVVSAGVTDGSYTHSYIVETTVSSPTGRAAFGTKRSTGFARADVSLAWDWNDPGEYVTDSDHLARCPGDELNYFPIGSTFINITLTRSSYLGVSQDPDGKCVFELQCAPGTSATCPLANPRGLPVGTTCAQTWGKYFWCLDVSYFGVCVKPATVCVGPWNLPQACT